jgi:hypothetical protein
MSQATSPVFTRDRVLDSEWPAARRQGIIWALSALIDALETYKVVRQYAIRPVRPPGGPGHQGDTWDSDAWIRALSVAAREAAAWAAELDRLVPAAASTGVKRSAECDTA